MIHKKSFKPAKCKTALKMVVSRAKLLKNKKEVLVKQLRRDLAQLLDSGQDQTARIRVEHVNREEKMMAAYELIEIFCELIANRLPIIESQKNCPVDLKEAVSSVIFAAPRCSDIPELADVRKHFTAKYGKEFVSAAIELRPDCSVNRTLVEKLSAKAPDGPTKLKILTAIAEEHNIKWEPKSFGDKDSKFQEDLLNISKTLENASKMHMKSSNVQGPYYDKVSSNVCIPHQYEVKQGAPMDYHGNNFRSSFGPQKVTSAHVDASATPSPNLKASECGIERTEYSNLYPEDQNPNFVNRQNWNMEFKDATSAAQAAAESAERASMAARAAAELSSRGKLMTQYSTGSKNSSANALRGEMPRRHYQSNFDSEASAKGQANLELRSSRSQNEAADARERRDFMVHAERLYGDGNKNSNRPSNLATVTSNSYSSKGDSPRPLEHKMSDESSQSYGGWNYQVQTSMNEDDDEDEEDVDLAMLTKRLARGCHQSEPGSRPSSSQKTRGDSFSNTAPFGNSRSSQNLPHIEDVVTVDEFSMRRRFQKLKVEPSDEIQDVLRTEKLTNLEDERLRQHSAFASSPCHSSFSSLVSDRQESLVPGSKNLDDGVNENPFANFDEKRYHKEAKTTKDGGAVVYDDYGSDGENSVFDLDKGPEISSHIFSPDRKSTRYLSENINAPSRRNRVDLFGNSTSELHPSKGQSTASVFSEALDDSAVFDDARWPTSESEEEPEDFDRYQSDILSSQPKVSQFNSIGKVSDKFDDPIMKNKERPHHLRVSLTHKAEADNLSPEKSAIMDDLETLAKSSSDGATGLSIRKLTGGLRNKGYRHPPYVRGLSGEASLSRQAAAGEMKNSHVPNSPKTWSSCETTDDPYDQEVNTEIQKRISSTGTFKRNPLGDASAVRKSLEDTARKSSFSPTAPKESIDSGIGDLNTQDKIVEPTRLSAKLEEKSKWSSLSEALLYKQAVVDPSAKYGFSSPSRKVSGYYLDPKNHGMDLAADKRMRSGDSISSYETEQSEDPKVEVLSQVSGSRTPYGAGLSRRTKGSTLKTNMTSLLKPSTAPHEEETPEPLGFSSRRSYTDKRSEVASVYPSKEGETQERRMDIRSSSRSSYSSERSIQSERDALDNRDSSNRLLSSREATGKPKSEPSKFSSRGSYTDRRSKLVSAYSSEDDETRERSEDKKSSSRSSYGTEAYRSTRAKGSAMDDMSSSDRLQSSKALEKPKSEPSKSSERPPDSPQMSGSLGAASQSSKPTKPSLVDTSRENSFNRASHVHPKLPDYDTIAAQLELLRTNRK